MTPYYDQNGITIYCGDNRKIAPLLGQFDLLLTDPPYGIGADSGMGAGGYDSTGKWKRKPRQYQGDWDSESPTREDLSLAVSLAKRAIIWGGNYLPIDCSGSGKWLVWNKEQVMPTYSDAELAWTNLDGVGVKLYTIHCNKARVEQGLHPTQKPLALISWCLSHAPDAKTVLDPWMGSGTTLVAAKLRGLRATGIEINEDYCRAAVNRLAQEVLAL